MLLALVAVAIPATALAAPFGTSGHGNCTFTTNAKAKTVSLVANCTTDTTIGVPDGYTLDGKGFTITAVDGTEAFVGAVVENDGTTMNVKNLKVDSASNATNCGAVNGVAFTYAGGSISNVTLTNIGRLVDDGCNNGRAILVDAIVKIEGNTVSSYNKNGIDVRGNVDAKIIGNTVTGKKSALVARNGIVVRTGASAQVWDNTVSGNVYTPGDVAATGILAYDGGTVNMTKANTLFSNDVDFLNEGGTVVGKVKFIA